MKSDESTRGRALSAGTTGRAGTASGGTRIPRTKRFLLGVTRGETGCRFDARAVLLIVLIGGAACLFS